MSHDSTLQGPNLRQGITLSELEVDEPLLGHNEEEPILVIRSEDGSLRAMSATCTHYGGPLAEGCLSGHDIVCPWHHARFDITTGRADAPGLAPLKQYNVIQEGDEVRVGDPIETRERPAAGVSSGQVVIIGGGAAGAACAERLWRDGFSGPITIISRSEPFPVDRPNLSKDFLAGEASAEWLPVNPQSFYTDKGITWIQEPAVSIDRDAREVHLETGQRVSYDQLLIATGTRARALSIPGADAEHVHTLHMLDDAKAILEHVEDAESAVVVGAGFIGLEVAASLREHDLDVTLVAPEPEPLQGVLGTEVGRAIRGLHEKNGVRFELEHTPAAIDDDAVLLDDGRRMDADLVVLGVGVEPRIELAAEAGLEVDDGVVVNRELRTSDPAIFAAGDIAQFPLHGSSTRIEHWAVAQRQGQTVADNVIGNFNEFNDVPFFWSRHPGADLHMVGHAKDWSETHVDGDLDALDATIAYCKDDRILAVATLGRPEISLKAEAMLASNHQEALAELVGMA